jgi:hypothetical protein
MITYRVFVRGKPGVFETGLECPPRDEMILAKDDAAFLAGYRSWSHMKGKAYLPSHIVIQQRTDNGNGNNG